MSLFSFLSPKKKILDPSEILTAETNNTFRDVRSVQSEVMDVAIHQLKTPLVGMKWSLKMILGGNVGPLNSEQKALLEQCYESNEKIIETIDGLLYVDKIEAKTYRYTFLNAYLPELIETKIAELKPNAESKRITIRSKIDGDIPTISLDAEKILTVIQGLVENSLRYTGKDGVITVRVSKNSDFVQVTVEDNGVGIPAAEQDHIFTKFFRATNAKIVDPNGSGLGLYIAKDIVLKHGGKIWFESREGKGTKVYFTLPIKR